MLKPWGAAIMIKTKKISMGMILGMGIIPIYKPRPPSLY